MSEVSQPTISWEDARVQIVYEILAQSGDIGPADPAEHWEGWQARRIVEALFPPATPAALWRRAGESDPHPDLVEQERAQLPMGQLTDDELANEAFLNFDRQPTFTDLMRGRGFTPMVWMTAVKERVRWLSRQLVKAQTRVIELEAKTPTRNRLLELVANWTLVGGGIWLKGRADEAHRLRAWKMLDNDTLELILDKDEPNRVVLDKSMWPYLTYSDRPDGGICVELPPIEDGYVALQRRFSRLMQEGPHLVIARGTRSLPMKITRINIAKSGLCIHYVSKGIDKSVLVDVDTALALRIEVDMTERVILYLE